jgi:ATP-binding cassette subfamily C protein
LVALDEPNAHLDSEGEEALVRTLKAASERGVCSIVVAHRQGLLAAANKLLVVTNGRIDTFGPRDQVLARLNPGPRSVPPPTETGGVRS